MGAIDIEFPVELVLSESGQTPIGLIERQTTAGRDGSGARVEHWAQLYPNWPGTVWLREKPQETTFGQLALEYAGKVYFPPASLMSGAYVYDPEDGTLPDIRIRDRMQWGLWPAGWATVPLDKRYLIVDRVLDPVGNGTMIVAWVSAKAPQ